MKIYRNNLKNRFLAVSALPQIFCLRSCLASSNGHSLQTKNSEEPPCQNPDSSSCFGIQSFKLYSSRLISLKQLLCIVTAKNRFFRLFRYKHTHAAVPIPQKEYPDAVNTPASKEERFELFLCNWAPSCCLRKQSNTPQKEAQLHYVLLSLHKFLPRMGRQTCMTRNNGQYQE